MPIDPQEFAALLGAEIVGEVPDVGGGPFGMARLAHILQERLTPSQGQRPGRPTNPNWVTRCKVPMSDATLKKLAELAEEASTAERKVSPMQVAAQLLEEAVGRAGVKAVSPDEERVLDSKAGEPSAPKRIKIRPPRDHEPQDKGRKAGGRQKKTGRSE
jgi:hypothetical protein